MILGHDYSIFPVQGLLTTDGVQYSDEVTTTTVNVDVDAFSHTFDLGFAKLGSYVSKIPRALLACYFEIHLMLGSVSTDTADVKFKAQARNKNGTWVDLFAFVTNDNIGTAYIEKTYKGWANLSSVFNQVPFDFRIIFQCNELNEGKAKLRNNSYFRAIFKDVL